MYKVKIGTESMYIEVIDTTMKKVLIRAIEECKKVENFKILEMRDSKNRLVDYELQIRKLKRPKRENLNGFMYKATKEKCYRSIQQSMWYKYKEEKYSKIKVDLKEIKDSSATLEELKENYQKYLKTLEN